MSHLLHDWSKEKEPILLKKSYKSLNSGRTVILSEWLDHKRTGLVFPALIDMSIIIETEGGRNYSFAQTSGWLVPRGSVESK